MHITKAAVASVSTAWSTSTSMTRDVDLRELAGEKLYVLDDDIEDAA